MSFARPIAASDINTFICDVIAPTATGVQATDTANLQAAINATPTHGWLHIPRGTYQLNAALVIANNIRITGASVFEILTGAPLPDYPFVAPYLGGTVLVQNAAATDVIQITGTMISVNLSDFGLMFGASIMFLNTGHGINVIPNLVSGQTYHTSGLVKSILRNLPVFGHDGNHYGFNLLNPMLLTLDTLRTYGGGVMAFVVDNPNVNYGNTVAIQPYGVLGTAGSANGFQLTGVGGSFGLLNLMTIIRPELLAEDFSPHFPGQATKPTSSQCLWNTTNPTYVTGIRVISPDLENDISGVTMPTNYSPGTYVDASGIMTPNAYITTPNYNPTKPPTVAVAAGAGTGATASLLGSGRPSDLSGTVILNTGTGTPSGDMFTVTFGEALLQSPKFIMVSLTYAGAGVTQQFGVHTFSVNGFTVQSQGNPAASTQYQISWQVVQN